MMVSLSSIRSRATLAALFVVVAGSGFLVVPPSWEAARLLLPASDEQDILAYRLQRLDATRYLSTIESALTADDPELAASILVLADDRGTEIPAALRERVTALQSFDPARSALRLWSGVSGGDAASAEALAGAVAADITGITDVRDLVREGAAYLYDQPYDPLVLGLAAVGLAVTGATVATVGGATPARVGVTALKVAGRVGTMRPALRGSLSALATDVIDRPAIGRTMTQIRRGNLDGAGMSAILRATPLRTLRGMATDLGGVAKKQGYRSANDILKIAESPADITRLSALASRLGTRFRGALALLGAGAFTLAGLAVTLTGWLMAATLWLISALVIGYRVFRFLARRFMFLGRVA